MEVICQRCPKYRARPSGYVNRLMRLRLLRLAGYPFAPDSMPMSMWEDLGVLESVIASKTPRLF